MKCWNLICQGKHIGISVIDECISNCYFCPLCVRNLETSMHLFIECPVAQGFWSDFSHWPRCAALAPTAWQPSASVTDAWLSMINATAPTLRGGIQTLIILICSSVWWERNSRVFRQKSCSTAFFVQSVSDEAREWLLLVPKS